MELGTTYTVQPEPPDPRCTVWIDAGSVRFGVESRHVDPEALRESYRDDPEGWAEIEAASPEGGFSDDGVSLHVVDAASGHEYLRFDAFDEEPHYHYVADSGDRNQVIAFDATANGDPLDWSLARLEARLAPMLVRAGAEGLVARLDDERVADGLARVRAVAHEAAGRSQRP
ncbi:MAG: hypothetical protein KDA97_08410 [Acidimicrobiales bacterium]|nr:hypothetical protein [Acidimicrobiales bacterium]